MAVALHAAASSTQIVRNKPQSASAEAFRGLRASLQFLPPDRQGSFIITSCAPGEGKTCVSVNLALALATAGKHVLLVDADMRRPMLHNVFGTGRTLGLSHLLSHQTEDDSPQDTEIAGLSVLPCGTLPPNPSELLGGAALPGYLGRWKQTYDHVIFDTPPLLGLADSLVLARQVGRALLVLRASETTDRSLRRAVAQLRDASVDVLGVVLNDVRLTPQSDGYGYQYYAREPADRG